MNFNINHFIAHKYFICYHHEFIDVVHEIAVYDRPASNLFQLPSRALVNKLLLNGKLRLKVIRPFLYTSLSSFGRRKLRALITYET